MKYLDFTMGGMSAWLFFTMQEFDYGSYFRDYGALVLFAVMVIYMVARTNYDNS